VGEAVTGGVSRVLTAAATVVLACACVHQPLATDAPVTPSPRPAGGPFDYETRPLDLRIEATENFAGYRTFRATFAPYFAPDDKTRVLAINAYMQDAPGVHPSIALFPILGGDYAETKAVADHLVASGFNVLRFERKAAFLAPGTTLEQQKDVVREVVIDARRALDWWLAQPGVDADRVGVVGISMGGIYATLLMAADPRIRAGVFVITGANVAELLARVTEIEVEEFRAPLLARGMTMDTLAAEAHRQFDPVDPAVFAAAIDPARVLMITSVVDKVVRRENADRLHAALHRPHRILLPVGHYSTAFYFPLIKKEMVAHFRAVLGSGT
jgi:dienelactone hydrolase